jgi:GntR family transcriptional regulator of arabinose operon
VIERKKDRVYGQLKRSILENLLSPGSRLPPERELARNLGVGHGTLRSALARLQAEGLIERIRSKGTFVSAQQHRRTFLLILPDGSENLETPSRYVAAGVEEYAESKAVTIERCPAGLFTSFSTRERQELLQRIGLSGIILETGHSRVSKELVSAVKELQLPTVIPHGLASDSEYCGFLVLRTDERAAFSEAYRYLADKNHFNVAGLFLRIPNEDPGFLRGFKPEDLLEFLQHNNLAAREDLIVEIPNDVEIIRTTVRRWMLGPEPPTAIVCHSDRLAMRVYNILRKMQISIPGQVSVVGYSNYPGSQLLLPPLTTIDTLLKNCAKLAIDKLLDSEEWYQEGVTATEVFTPYQFIERESVVPPVNV